MNKDTGMNPDNAVIKHKGYVQACLDCREEFEDVLEKMNICPLCKKPITYTYEHFVTPSDSANIYFHLCDKCKIRFDTDKETEICFKCQGETEQVGKCHTDFFPRHITVSTSFLFRIRRFFRSFLP